MLQSIARYRASAPIALRSPGILFASVTRRTLKKRVVSPASAVRAFDVRGLGLTSLISEERMAVIHSIHIPHINLRNPRIQGTICCLLAAVGFTTMNAGLRAATGIDAALAAAMRALIPAMVLAPWVMSRRLCRCTKPLMTIVAASLLVQLGGNLVFQYSLGLCGVVVTVPVVFGTMPVAATVLGRVFFGERPSLTYAIALGALVLSIVLIGGGQPRGMADSTSSGIWVLGVMAAIVAGTAYAIFIATVKHVTAQHLQVTEVALLNAVVGATVLGAIAMWRIGIASAWSGVCENAGPLTVAGIMNLVSFLLFARGLQLISVSYGSLFNSCQVAMSAAVGIVLFGETVSILLISGILLTCISLLFASLGAGQPAINHSSDTFSHHVPELPSNRLFALPTLPCITADSRRPRYSFKYHLF